MSDSQGKGRSWWGKLGSVHSQTGFLVRCSQLFPLDILIVWVGVLGHLLLKQHLQSVDCEPGPSYGFTSTCHQSL